MRHHAGGFLENAECAHEALRDSVWKGKSGLIERVCQGKFRASLLERLLGKAKIDGSSSDGEELQSVDDVVQLLVQHAKGKREADFLEVWGDYREHLGDAHLETVHNAWEGNDGLIESALTTARENPHAWNATISDAILHMVSVEDYETIIKDNVNDTSTPFADGVCMGHIASITGQPMKQFTRILQLFQQKPMILFACVKVEFLPTWLEEGDDDDDDEEEPERTRASL